MFSGQTFSHKEEKHTWRTAVVKSLGLSLLKDGTYVHITIGLALGYVSSISFSTFYPMFLQDEVQFPVMDTTYCMTALALADVIGRITSSELCRRLHLGNRSSFMAGCFFLGISRSCKFFIIFFLWHAAFSEEISKFCCCSEINVDK